MTYARELLATDRRAFFAFAKVMGMSRYRRDIPADVGHAVALVAILSEDCGPCTQLCITMALRGGVEMLQHLA
jgi:hypothetical protein